MDLPDFSTLEERTFLVASVREMGMAGRLTASVIARDTGLSENCVLGYVICFETYVHILCFIS